MRDEEQSTDVRLNAAKAAAPYCHPRLAAQRVTTRPDGGMTHEEWLEELQDAVDQANGVVLN